MPEKIIIGTLPNDGTGDDLRTAAAKINSNYTTTKTIASSSSSLDSEFILCDSTSGNITVTLPSKLADLIVSVKKIDSSVNEVSIIPFEINTEIEFATSLELVAQGESVDLVCNGTDWFIK